MPLIFDIKRYAINDGPGIRTTLFMKGCPLRCVWCHNPESWSPEPQVLYRQSKCIGCNSCGLFPDFKLPEQKSSIFNLQSSIQLCPTLALEMCGREWTMDALMAEVEKERVIMEDSGGGVTLCGGEPLMHPDYTIELLRELGRRGFHRTVDTALYATAQTVKAVAAHCELFLVDLKLMDDAKHRQYTGVGNQLILENIRLLATLGNTFAIRIPLIEGINADVENMEQTARFLSSLSPQAPSLTVHLLPYHDVGKDKHRRMWSQYNPQHIPMATPSEDVQHRCAYLLEAHGLHVVIGG